MPNLVLNSPFSTRESPAFETHELKSRYLFGVSLKDHQGQELSDETIKISILEAQAELEHLLSLKLVPQVVTESRTHYYDDWSSFGFIKTTWPVSCPISLTGKIASLTQLRYPKEWLSVRTTSDESTASRNFYIMPFSGSQYRDTTAMMSYQQAIWWRANAMIPNYWELKYVSGYRTLPMDLQAALGKMAAIKILTLGGQLTTTGGIKPGFSASSVSLDGLSQSLSPLANNQSGPYGSIIRQYASDLMVDLKNLRDYYTQISFTVC